MAEDDDDSQKTEQPTQKRLDDAMQKGNIPVSREVGSFFMLMVLALTVSWFTPSILRGGEILLAPFITDAADMPTDANGLGKLLSHVMFGASALIAAPLIASIAAALGASFLQNGIVFSTEKIMPSLDKISPLAGFKRLFSLRSVIELLKGILKIGIIGAVAFMAVYPQLPHIRQLPDSSQEGMLLFLAMLATKMTVGVAIAMFFIALFDVIYQRFEYVKSLRMTKQEIKDEFKQSEGDPMIKQRLRRLRMDRARKRMIAAVPKSDVVITNPTHFAVALSYVQDKMKAPQVTAKGQDLIALKMREIAEAHGVPIVENPPLARALYATAEIGDEVPVAHYEAVAKVISFVYRLKGKRFER